MIRLSDLMIKESTLDERKNIVNKEGDWILVHSEDGISDFYELRHRDGKSNMKIPSIYMDDLKTLFKKVK